MQIHGIEGLSKESIQTEVMRGGKFVIFQYCISVIILTFKKASDVYFIRAGESTFSKHILFTAISLFAGWWGFPWGPIYTISSVISNVRGGKNVTEAAIAYLNSGPVNPQPIQQPSIDSVSQETKRKRLLIIVFGLIAFLILVFILYKK